MSRIYSSTNRIRFTDIPEKYAIPRSFRGKQSEVHSAVVTYVFDHYKDTKKYRQSIVDSLNILTYCVMQNEFPSFDWAYTNPLENMPEIDMELVESTLGDFYLTPEAIEWDVSPSSELVSGSEESKPNVKVVEIEAPSFTKKQDAKKETSDKQPSIANRPLQQVKKQQKAEIVSKIKPTPKEDLYIQPPHCLRFDVTKIWKTVDTGSDKLVIYTTLPEIPTCQNEISVTTDPARMTDDEFMALYPNHIVHTRAPEMYYEHEGIDYDPELGCIIPIEGFTKDQIVDNIIKYPHLYRLRKMIDGNLQPFFRTIEIDGKLEPIAEYWDNIPESSVIPRHPEFVKEYVTRRYLLEREAGMSHHYDIVGGLDPFLTLFMPFTKYIERGYKDTLSIVKLCVNSRIHYKQTRNPILRRIEAIV